MLKHFIEQLSTDLGIEQGLEAKDDGTYSLRLEPDLDIDLRENSELGITLFTKLAELPPEDTEEYMLKAMVANLFGRETGGSALGLDNEGKRVVLINFLAEEITYREFHDTLEDFVNYAVAWREETLEFTEAKMDE